MIVTAIVMTAEDAVSIIANMISGRATDETTAGMIAAATMTVSNTTAMATITITKDEKNTTVITINAA